jgi:amino acid permease
MQTLKFKKPKITSILLYYSTILSTILIIGGFYTARSGKEVISNFLFLPIVIFLWMIFIQKRKEAKRLKIQGEKPKTKL